MRISATRKGQIIIELYNLHYDASRYAADIKLSWPLDKVDPFMQVWPKLSALSDADIMALPPIDIDPSRLINPIQSPNKILGAMANYRQPDGSVAENSIRKYGFFIKSNASMICPPDKVEKYPNMETLHEPELSILIGKEMRHADARAAADGITALCGSLDLTGRGDQLWSHRKSVDTYGVFDVWLTPMSRFGDASKLSDLDIELYINDELRQTGQTSRLIWSPIDLIVEASKYFTLYPGDLIMTGTPSGLGPIEPGDKIRMVLKGVSDFEISVT